MRSLINIAKERDAYFSNRISEDGLRTRNYKDYHSHFRPYSANDRIPNKDITTFFLILKKEKLDPSANMKSVDAFVWSSHFNHEEGVRYSLYIADENLNREKILEQAKHCIGDEKKSGIFELMCSVASNAEFNLKIIEEFYKDLRGDLRWISLMRNVSESAAFRYILSSKIIDEKMFRWFWHFDYYSEDIFNYIENNGCTIKPRIFNMLIDLDAVHGKKIEYVEKMMSWAIENNNINLVFEVLRHYSAVSECAKKEAGNLIARKGNIRNMHLIFDKHGIDPLESIHPSAIIDYNNEDLVKYALSKGNPRLKKYFEDYLMHHFYITNYKCARSVLPIAVHYDIKVPRKHAKAFARYAIGDFRWDATFHILKQYPNMMRDRKLMEKIMRMMEVQATSRELLALDHPFVNIHSDNFKACIDRAASEAYVRFSMEKSSSFRAEALETGLIYMSKSSYPYGKDLIKRIIGEGGKNVHAALMNAAKNGSKSFESLLKDALIDTKSTRLQEWGLRKGLSESFKYGPTGIFKMFEKAIVKYCMENKMQGK